MDYAALLARFKEHGARAYATLRENRREYPVVRIDTRGTPRLLITAGFHGEEPAGPLTLATHFSTIAAYAKKRKVGLTVFPCINPSGFEAGTRYNASGEKPNNDFLRYVLDDGSIAGELYGKNPPFKKTKRYRRTPKETRALGRELDRLATPVAALDLHQDNYMRRAATYAYVFGEAKTYAPLARRSSKHLELASHAQVDPHLHTDAHGFIWFHDGSVTDWFMRRGTRYLATLETTTQSEMKACHAVNLIWIKGFIDLTARTR